MYFSEYLIKSSSLRWRPSFHHIQVSVHILAFTSSTTLILRLCSNIHEAKSDILVWHDRLSAQS